MGNLFGKLVQSVLVCELFLSACSGVSGTPDYPVASQTPSPIVVQTTVAALTSETTTATITPPVTKVPPLATERLLAATVEPQATFQGERAYEDVKSQVGFGPRLPGSLAHAQTVDFLRKELKAAGWESQVQETQFAGQKIRNIVATRGDLEKINAPWIILGAHFDTRLVADQDPDPAKQTQPVPGANDGASGVAVLLELARAIPREIDKRVWLVFFDAEDNGRIPSWDWILGSQAFVQALEGRPDAAVIVDMVGDENLNIPLEQNSDPQLAGQIWQIAKELGYGDRIINAPGKRILDDHIPFLEAGIPAVDMIDIDYPYWHTTEDTTDKVSAQSLQVVGDTLLAWLNRPWRP